MPLAIPSKLELKNLRAVADFTDKKVVEIGAGNGRLTWPLALVAAQWINLDPNAGETRAAAQALSLTPNSSVHLARADGCALSLPAAYFDIAFFSWSLC